MKTIKVDDVTYKIRIVPLHLSPFTNRYTELATKKAGCPKEAEKIATEIKEIIMRVLKDTVTSGVSDEHKGRVFGMVLSYTNATMKADKKLFREPDEPDGS